MRLRLLAIVLSLGSTRCVEKSCHAGAACDPNAQIAANMNVVGTNCGTFTIDNNTIVDPNHAAICAHNAFTNNQPFTFTWVAIANGVTYIDVYEVPANANAITIQTRIAGDYNTATLEYCDGITFYASSSDVLNPNSPYYGNYQLQCTSYTPISTLCDSQEVCE